MFSVIISKDHFDRLQSRLFTSDGFENAAFGICGSSTSNDHVRLYLRQLFPVPDDGYKTRTEYHLEVSPFFINEVIDAARGKFSIVIIHSHPGSLTTEYSVSDDRGEARLFEVFQALLPQTPHASLLFSMRATRGRFWDKKQFRNIDDLRIVGSSWRKISLERHARSAKMQNLGIYNRQVLAFGDEMQSQLGTLRVGVVGLGGTGSNVAEQLVRLGVRSFALVDDDRLDPTNITRTYGSKESDISTLQPKAKIAARNLRSINKHITIQEIMDSAIYQKTLMKLRDLDFLFCCTDNDLSRSIINRFSYQYSLPVIDMGIQIVAQKSTILAAAGRVSMIGPGIPCLRCSHHLDSERIRVESLPRVERERLQKEGYIQGVEVRAPAVISLTSTVSSLAVTMFLSALSGFSSVPSVASEQIYDALEGIVFRSKPRFDAECLVCGPNGVTGLGDLQVVSTYEELPAADFGEKRKTKNPT